METQLLKLLQLTKTEYEVKVISNYVKWCSEHESNDQEAQKLIANPPLFNWWLKEYRKLEEKFIMVATPYKSYMSKSDMEIVYKNEVIFIHNIFSKPLIHHAKHFSQPIINPQAN